MLDIILICVSLPLDIIPKYKRLEKNGAWMETTYLAIGEAMELKVDNPLVSTFVEGAGGKNSVITILPTASDYGKEIGPLYKDIFSETSADVEFFLIDKRSDTENPKLLDRMRNTTGIFFTGGNQLRITSLLGGSLLMKEINRARNRGVFIAGTSAGASAMTTTMIAGGKSDIMYKGNIELSPGLGFLDGAIIDSHFIKRGRMTRLLNLVCLNPGVLGLGLSEDTGILFKNSDPVLTVMGSRQLVVVDGRAISHTNIAQIEEKKPFSVTDVRVHVLGAYYRYNMETHEISIPDFDPTKNIPPPVDEISDLPYRPMKKLEKSNW